MAQFVQYPGLATINFSGSIGTVDQGTPNSIGNAWPVLPTDGTNSQQFTAAGEVMVAITQSIPAGSNSIGNIEVSSSALPTGASTSALQTTGNTSLSSIDGKITAVNTGAVVVASSALPTGAATQATLSALNAKVTACDTDNVTITTMSLPLGASTSALQTDANNILTDIEAKTPAFGQATMANSSPVVIASNQTAIPVSGSFTVTSSALPTNAATETGGNLQTVATNTGAISTDTGDIVTNTSNIAGRMYPQGLTAVTANNSIVSYTVPAGKYARISAFVGSQSGVGSGFVSLDGNAMINAATVTAGSSITASQYVPTGTVIQCQSNNGNTHCYVSVALYNI